MQFMKTKTWMMSVLATLVLVFSATGVQGSNLVLANDDVVSISILHTNDIHSTINDFGKIAAYLDAERERNENTLYLDAGDFFSGSPVVDLVNGKPMIELLNKLELDATVIGNHEFDYGQEEFAARMAESNFPWLSANMEVVSPTFPIEQPEPYHIFEVDGLEVGVFALTQNPPATAPAGVVGIDFHDYVETANQYAYLADEVDILIALTHIGHGADRQLAEEVEFFDLIIGGHTHTAVHEPVVVNGTPITQAGSNGRFVGHLTLDYHTATEELEVNGFLQNVAELTEVNEDVQAMVDQYIADMDELLNQEIGHTNTGLYRDDRYEMDVSLGNFWTDAMLDSIGADVAFTNNGGIRADISPGTITAGDIYTVEPFANEVMEIHMTGAAIKDVIDYSYQRRNQIDLQIAGFTYTILTDETGEFVDSIVYDQGQPIDLDKVYVVAVSDYLGTGGGGYELVGEIVQTSAGYMTNAMLMYAEELMRTKNAVDYLPTEGRISVQVVEEQAPITVPAPFKDGKFIPKPFQDGLPSENGKFKGLTQRP